MSAEWSIEQDNLLKNAADIHGDNVLAIKKELKNVKRVAQIRQRMHQLGLFNSSQVLQTPVESKKTRGKRTIKDSPVVGQIVSALKGKPVEKKIEILKENVQIKKKMMTRSYLPRNTVKKAPVMDLKPFTKEISDVTPARRAAMKAQKVTKPKKETLEEIKINENVNQVDNPVENQVQTPKKELSFVDKGSEKGSVKRKRTKSPSSVRSTRSKMLIEEKSVTPLSTRSTRSRVVLDEKEKSNSSLNHFFAEEDEDSFEDENVILGQEEDTTLFTKIWNGVMSTLKIIKTPMLASDAPMVSLNMPSERFDHQRALKEERARDMKSFLDKQARENPRLRRLRAINAPIQTSITHPRQKEEANEFQNNYDNYDNAAAESNRSRNDKDLRSLETERVFGNLNPSPPKSNHSRYESNDNYYPTDRAYGIPPPDSYRNQGGGPWPRYNQPWYPPPMPPMHQNNYYAPYDNYSSYPERGYQRDNYGPNNNGRNLEPLPPVGFRDPEPHINSQYPPNTISSQYPDRQSYYRQEFGESDSISPAASKSKAQNYAAELQKQIEEKKARERAEKQTVSNLFSFKAMSSSFPNHTNNQSGIINGSSDQVAYVSRRGGYNNPDNSNEKAASNSKKQNYLNDLNEQIRLKKEREQQEKMKLRMEDQRKANEIEGYAPWGKGGAGAPHKTSTEGNFSGRGGARKNMELQGSNLFSNSNRDMYPPAIDHSQSTPNQAQMTGGLNMNSGGESNSFGQGNQYFQPSGGYKTEDIFASTSNPFIETLRSLALNPSQINTLLSTLPAAALPGLQTIQSTQSNERNDSMSAQGDNKNFLRGVKNIESLPDWQRSEVLKKQNEQASIQDALKHQIAQKNAEKALQAKAKKEDEEREQLRLEKEREFLREKYSKEMEDQRRREEEARIENERKAREKADQMKSEQHEEQTRLADDRRSQKATQKRNEEASNVNNVARIQPIPPRIASPPVPALMKRMSAISSPVPISEAQIFNTLPAANHENNEFMTNIPPSYAPGKVAASSETQELLQQLAAIQRELESEERNIQIDMRIPMSFESTLHVKLPEIHKKANTTSISDMSYDKRNNAGFFDIMREIEPEKSSTLHLKKQNALLKEQEKELAFLKESLVHREMNSQMKSPRSRHFRSTAKWNHDDDFLAKYLSKEPSKRNEMDDFDTHELRLNVEEETADKVKNYLSLNDDKLSSFESRPRSRRREAKQRNRSSEEETPSNTARNDKNSETRSDSSLDIALIEELNEKRLRRLAELHSESKIKAIPETDIIDSFLKRETLKSLIPSTESAFQPIY